MSVIGSQNLRLGANKGLEVVNGRDLAVKVNAGTLQLDANGVGLKDGAVSAAHLESGLASIQNDTLKRAFWSSIATNHAITAAQQPASLADSLFAGKSAGGAVNGNGTAGVVSGSFANEALETGTDAGQAGLGAAAADNRPYPVADYPGQRGILVALHKTDGDDVLLGDIVASPAPEDPSSRVYGYLSYRSDLPADQKWRLYYYCRASETGYETPITPDTTLNGVTIHVPEVLFASQVPVRAGLGIVSPAGQAAAAVGPKSIGTAELDDAAVTAAKLASDSVTNVKLAADAVTSAKLANDAVTTTKLQDAAVTTAKLADANVSEAKLANEAVTSSKLKMKRRFERLVGVSANGATLTLARSVLAGREEAVMLTEDGAFIDYVAASPDESPSKEFTVSNNTITLGFTQVEGAVYRIWIDSEDS